MCFSVEQNLISRLCDYFYLINCHLQCTADAPLLECCGKLIGYLIFLQQEVQSVIIIIQIICIIVGEQVMHNAL